MDPLTRRRGFTLIELLIVVAIIAILAAIAVPNFLEAQVRAKVSRTRADMRSMATALEAYHIDHNEYPGCVNVNLSTTTNLTPGRTATPRINALVQVTTPIAYVTSAFKDVFNTMDGAFSPTTSPEDQRVLVYWGTDFLIEYEGTDLRPRTSVIFREFTDVADDSGRVRESLWTLMSYGPDQDLDIDDVPTATTDYSGTLAVIQPYDPTNGTISDGDIVRFRE
ncbi:prepilin-type N-terminal cleavage/methylation domain-containing protein [Candidatus Sumerlaeota bacterium]|nr:prepilin-type N-terminal cleavage/methylation domain-containing protein [Candidatus Sumerlaeota bacterium]